MGGLTRKYDYEKGLQRDKAQKGDYREDLYEPISQKLPSSSLSMLGLRLTSTGFVRTPAFYREMGRYWKQRIKVELRRITNKFPIAVDGFRFAFKWSVVEFAKQNSLTDEKAKIIYPKIKTAATERRNMLELRLSRSEVERRSEYDPQSGEDTGHSAWIFPSTILPRFCRSQMNSRLRTSCLEGTTKQRKLNLL